MREEMDNRFEAIFRETKTNKNASTVTNPRSEFNQIRDPQPSGSKTKSIGVRASNNKNSDSENGDYPLTASKMKDLKHPTKPFFQNQSDVDVTILSNEETDAEEDYYRAETKCFAFFEVGPVDWLPDESAPIKPFMLFADSFKPTTLSSSLQLNIYEFSSFKTVYSLIASSRISYFAGRNAEINNLGRFQLDFFIAWLMLGPEC